MRLFEAIVDANHRAIAGDATAGVRVAEFESELPVIALTCVDPRLNALFPNVLGLPGEQFIWLRNAGNIITGPLSSTMRSLALACAVKGGKGDAEVLAARSTDETGIADQATPWREGAVGVRNRWRERCQGQRAHEVSQRNKGG